MNYARFSWLILFNLVALHAEPWPAQAQFTRADSLSAAVPGQVYRESGIAIGTSTGTWRVTDPDSPYQGDPSNSPSTYLPNALLDLPVEDLQGAVRAVAVIDVWGGHVGTVGKQFRLNGSDWIDIPDIQNTPGDPECYVHQATIEVEIPLESLVEGINVLEGTSGGQTCFGFNWGQWGWYGFMLRVFYDPAAKATPVASIVRPSSGATIGARETFEVQATGSVEIQRVDFVGRYEAYDVDGDGLDSEWQESLHRLKEDNVLVPRDHIGTATSSPFRLAWDTEWVPDQPSGGIDVAARVLGANGLWVVTDHVSGLSLERPGVQVSYYEPRNVPVNYWVRSSSLRSSRIDIPATEDLTTLQGARMLVRTWNGVDGEREPGEIFWTGLNDWVAPVYGEDHFYSYDQVPVPGADLVVGSNTFKFYSESTHHGIEVLWPGPALVARYEDMSGVPAYVVGTPEDAVVIEGGNASFSIGARGEEPISFQWQRNGIDIDGADASTLQVEAIDLSADGDVFRCVVTNINGSSVSDEATIAVIAPGPRVEEGLIALYTFDEGAGDTVFDRTDAGADLVIADSTAVRWTEGALAVDTATTIATVGAATSIVDAVRASNEVTLEAWIQTADLGQNGPARIVSLSAGSTSRNLTLGQGVFGGGSDLFDVRLRSTATNDNGQPSLTSLPGTLGPDLTHVMFTRNAGGATRMYVDGVLQASSSVFGDLSNWGDGFRLGLANEPNGGRPWLGAFHLVALYDRALNASEAFANFASGTPDVEIVTSTPSRSAFALANNVPNPFNPSTQISFDLPVTSEVLLEVYDLKGRKVRRLIDARQTAGRHAVPWDGTDDGGRGVASGVYIYRLRAVGADGSSFERARTMLLLK